MDESKHSYHYLWGPELLRAIKETDILDMDMAGDATIDISNEDFVKVNVTFPISLEQWAQINNAL